MLTRDKDRFKKLGLAISEEHKGRLIDEEFDAIEKYLQHTLVELSQSKQNTQWLAKGNDGDILHIEKGSYKWSDPAALVGKGALIEVTPNSFDWGDGNRPVGLYWVENGRATHLPVRYPSRLDTGEYQAIYRGLSLRPTATDDKDFSSKYQLEVISREELKFAYKASDFANTMFKDVSVSEKALSDFKLKYEEYALKHKHEFLPETTNVTNNYMKYACTANDLRHKLTEFVEYYKSEVLDIGFNLEHLPIYVRFNANNEEFLIPPSSSELFELWKKLIQNPDYMRYMILNLTDSQFAFDVPSIKVHDEEIENIPVTDEELMKQFKVTMFLKDKVMQHGTLGCYLRPDQKQQIMTKNLQPIELGPVGHVPIIGSATFIPARPNLIHRITYKRGSMPAGELQDYNVCVEKIFDEEVMAAFKRVFPNIE